MKKLYILMMAFGFIAGCGKKQPVQTIDYYLAHQDEMKKQIEDCKSRIHTASDLPEVMKDENCANADMAAKRWMDEYTRSSGKALPQHHTYFDKSNSGDTNTQAGKTVRLHPYGN